MYRWLSWFPVTVWLQASFRVCASRHPACDMPSSSFGDCALVCHAQFQWPYNFSCGERGAGLVTWQHGTQGLLAQASSPWTLLFPLCYLQNQNIYWSTKCTQTGVGRVAAEVGNFHWQVHAGGMGGCPGSSLWGGGTWSLPLRHTPQVAGLSFLPSPLTGLVPMHFRQALECLGRGPGHIPRPHSP